MAPGQNTRVSHFREDSMTEVDAPQLTPRSCTYSPRFDRVAESTFNYKPFILRTVPLLLLLALTLALIGLIEYAIGQVPHGSLNLKRRDEVLMRRSDEDHRVLPRKDSSGTIASPSIALNSSSSVVPPPAYTSPSAHVDESSTLVFASTDQSAFVQPDPTTTTQKDITAFTADPSAYVQDRSTSSSTETILFNTAQSAYVSGDPPEPTAEDDVDRPSVIVSTMTTPTSAYVPGQPTSGPGPSQDGEEDDDDTSQGGSDDSEDSTFDNQNAALAGDDHDSDGVVIRILDAQEIFLGNYLAVCIAVIYRLLWVMLHIAFNLIEPFRQLMDRDGAPAETAFFAFYQSQSNLLGPIPALIKRRWTLALLGLTCLIVNFFPALASESVYVDTKWDCPNPNLENDNPCNPRLTANVTVLRAMQGLLCFTAIVILVTTSLLLFNKTGLPTKPNSVAAVASLMRRPRLLAELSDMPVNASTEHMRQFMKGKRYRMGHYTCANGLAGYGILSRNGYDCDQYAAPLNSSQHGYTPVEGSTPFSVTQDSRLRRFRILEFVLAFFLLGTFGVVLAYYLNGNADGFNRFFNSNTFGPRFILTFAGTIIASIWKSVEQDAIVMAPYNRLFTRPSSPSSTILLAPTSTPITSTLRMLRHRYFLAASITILTLAAEALNIVISGVPFSSGQRWIQYLVSTYMSLAILGTMIILTAVIIVVRCWEPTIPRTPSTLAAVMSYLCSSRMLDDFEGMEGLDDRTKKQRSRVMSKKYEFARDGKLAWTVDDALDRPKY